MPVKVSIDSSLFDTILQADPQNCPDASLGKKKKKPKLKRVLMSRSKADLNSSKGMCFVRNKGKNLSCK